MTTVTRAPGRRQTRGASSTENALIGGLLLVTGLSIGAVVCIVLTGGQEAGSTAPVAIPAISTIALAAISTIAVVLRRRPGRTRR